MAPSIPSSVSTATMPAITSKPTLYILSEFHPTSLKHAESLFTCILPSNPQATHWRTHATAILIKDYHISEADLAAAPQLRIIGKQGVGLDKIDTDACKRHNVRICNTPGVNASAVAEMTLALALAVARQIPSLTHRQRAGGEAIRKETVRGALLTNKTLGVIGMGHIGRSVARIFHGAFQSRILAYDPYFAEENIDGKEKWKDTPHTRVHNLSSLLQESDIVSVHVPLTPGTRGLIARPELEMMKRSAILLNTARGGIVDEEDLAAALEEGLIWGAGIDCHVQEPPTRERYGRFWGHARVVGTPHVAAATEETQIATTNAAIDGVYAYINT